MDLDFTEALNRLGRDAGFRIANEVRPDSEYALNALLPERNMDTYDIKAGNMIVRATMPGLVGMDSAYPPGGVVESSKFAAETAKFAQEVFLPEETIRLLQTTLARISNVGMAVNTVVTESLNFLNKVVIQPHRDLGEYLRGQTLSYGVLDWTFNGIRLLIDYGVPAANKLTLRTIASNNAYGGSASKFWEDVWAAQELLNYDVRGFWLNSKTLRVILTNTVNSLAVISRTDSMITLRKYVAIQGNTQFSDDNRDLVTFNIYDGEGEVLDPAAPSTTKKLKFIPDGKIFAAGNNSRRGYRPGEGATRDPAFERALGYTHIAPTVEGGGRAGRWAELYIPQGKPYQLNGRGVTNGLPVLEAPDKLAILTTELP